MSQGNPAVSLGVVSLGVGIDTARYGHHVSFLDEQKRTAAKSFHFTESAAGYQQLQAALMKLAQNHPGVHFHIRLDAAGQYAENLLQWLHRLPLSTTISVGQPARNKAYRQVHFDKRKADPVESLACARFAIVERPAATPHNPPEFQQLRDAVALMEASSKQRTRLINQLHGLLARVFPELAVHVKDLSANWVLSLLEKYPTPDKLARAKTESLAEIPHLATDLAELPHKYGRQLEHRTKAGGLYFASEYIQAQRVRTLIQQAVAALFQHIDLLLCPTMPTEPPTYEASLADTWMRRPGITNLFNLTGHPVVAVPCGFSAEGLPVSLQLVGRPFDEATILRLAQAYQDATAWHRRRPPAAP